MKSKLAVSAWCHANEVCKRFSNRVLGQARNLIIISGAAEAHKSIDQIDHSCWSDLLDSYVDETGRVSYSRWQNSNEDKDRLEQYLLSLTTVHFNEVTVDNKPTARDSIHDWRTAFWLNAYNALTIFGILQLYPTQSIRNHTPKLFGFNIWHDLRLRIGDQDYSLNTIEHSILRKLNEPRIHFAIVCASNGCPPLFRQAFAGNLLDTQLEQRSRLFFSQSSNFQFQELTNHAKLSSILDWFGCDFGNNEPEMLKRIAMYLPSPTARRMAATGKSKISYLNYDWSLNDQSN